MCFTEPVAVEIEEDSGKYFIVFNNYWINLYVLYVILFCINRISEPAFSLLLIDLFLGEGPVNHPSEPTTGVSKLVIAGKS